MGYGLTFKDYEQSSQSVLVSHWILVFYVVMVPWFLENDDKSVPASMSLTSSHRDQSQKEPETVVAPKKKKCCGR